MRYCPWFDRYLPLLAFARERDACIHQLIEALRVLDVTEALGELEMGSVVDPEGFFKVVGADRVHSSTVVEQMLDDVGQVELALRIIVGQPRQRPLQRLNVEAIHANVD